MTEFHSLRDPAFQDLFAQYRKHHPACYALRIAYDIAFNGLPF